MPRANPIKACQGCNDRAIRAALPPEQQCSQCRKKERNRLWREAHPGVMAANARRWRDAGNKTERTEAYRERERQRNRERYRRDPTVREASKRANEKRRREKPEAVRAANKAWREANLEHSRSYHRDYSREKRQTPEGKAAVKAIRERRRQQRQVEQARYNARRYGAHGELDSQFLNWLHKWQDHCCAYCNAPLNGSETIEHIVSLNSGGTNLPHNVVLACARCNTSKSDRSLDSWAPNQLYPAPFFHSRYMTGKVFELIHPLFRVDRAADHIVMPNGRKLFVLSSFWLAERLTPPTVNMSVLAAQHPDAVFTFDFEWRARAEALLSSLTAKAGAAPSVGARELIVDTPDTTQARAFINRWHVQGFAAGTWYCGLRDATGAWHAVCSATDRGDGNYTLDRLAFRSHVAGGFSRIVAALRKTIGKPGQLTTYADMRLGDGAGYKQAGFTLQGSTVPSFHYVNATGLYHWNLYTKTAMAKKLDFFDATWPGWRLARANGLWRVDDLALRRFVLQFS